MPRPGAPDGAIELDDFFGLHPRMAPLKPLWDNQLAGHRPRERLARSHALALRRAGLHGERHAGREEHARRLVEPLPAGRRADPSPLRGVAVARQMPRALQGKAPSLAFGGVDAFDVRGGMDSQQSFETAFSEADNPLLRGTAKDAFEAMRTLRDASARPIAAGGVEYPRSPFGQALQEIARVAKADVGLEVAFAESSNWDHHANEGGAHGPDRAAARRSVAAASPRSPPISAIAWPTPSS